MHLLDVALTLLFLTGIVFALLAGRWDKGWMLAITVATTLALGVRSLYLMEFGSAWLAGVLGVLFVLGLAVIWAGVERAKIQR